MIPLQISPYAFQSAFVQYGVLGIVAFVLGYFAWTSYKSLVHRNDALEKKVDNLQDEVRQLLVEERDRMSKIIEENTKAITELRHIIVSALLNTQIEK
jgi:hypothetical protein